MPLLCGLLTGVKSRSAQKQRRFAPSAGDIGAAVIGPPLTRCLVRAMPKRRSTVVIIRSPTHFGGDLGIGPAS